VVVAVAESGQLGDTAALVVSSDLEDRFWNGSDGFGPTSVPISSAALER
jgi:hypothetical protein